jgi:septum site-determining protein MinC
MSDSSSPRKSIRFRGRSYIAFVLTPEIPVSDWLAGLDEEIGRVAGYLNRKPVVLDLSAARLSNAAIAQLVGELQARNIRIMGLDGIDPSELGPDLPPPVSGGRSTMAAAMPEPREPSKLARHAPASLLVENPVRSGQSIVFPHGDITVLGSVASGAEVIAGGSIHVYGTLRGRALAGSTGNGRARIFCSKVDAELLAIDGFYRTADDIESTLRCQPVQAWLQGDMMFIGPLN